MFEHANWAGGRQNYLCASLAPKYVKRNYTEILKHINLDCVYLDVFSCNEMDECFNLEHLMTRKECMEYIRKKVGMKKERKVCPIIFNWLHLPPE